MSTYGETKAREVALRVGKATATTTTLKALPADSENRADGCFTVVLADSSVWIFDADSAAGASATVLVPDAGSGRFLKWVEAAGGVAADLVTVADADSVIAAADAEAALAELSKRLLGAVANTAAITALAAAKRVDGGLVVDLATYLVWQFDAGSSAAASALVLVPDVGTGRWVRKSGIEIAVKTVTHTDLTDADGAQSFDLAPALPAGGVALAHGVNVRTAFTDGAAGVFTFDLGIKGGDTDAFIAAGALGSIAKVCTPAGVSPSGLFGAITVAIDVKATVNVNTCTAGDLDAYTLYATAF